MSTRRPSRPCPLAPLLLAALLALATAGCGGGGGTAPAAETAAGGGGAAEGDWFVDAAAASGIDFHHFNGGSGRFHMVEILGSGGGLFDYDGDGDLDAYLVQGAMLDPDRTLDDAVFPLRHPAPPSDRLYRNDLAREGSGAVRLRFTDVTEESGLAGLATGYGMGMAAGDYDGDGDLDLYLTNYGPDQLLENRGDGTFADVTAEAGLGADGWSVPAAFFDMDADGDLDLFVGRYVTYDLADPPVCPDLTGAPDFCGPKSFPPQSDLLYENRGDGTFRDVTAERGLTGGFGPALGVVVADFDDDGAFDLYVANDAAPNNLWMNRGDGTFEDRALLAGAAVDERGRPQGSMGVDAGDFDGDGDLDLFMTHIVQETNTLYRNDGGGMFEDHSAEVGLGAPSLPYTAFGTAWADLDNDGWLDLLVVNGAVTKILSLARQGDPYPLHQPNQLFRNQGGRFTEVTAEAGEVFSLSEVSRGAAFGDVDEDGDVDVLITNNAGPARLLVNRRGQDRPWLGLRLLTAGGRRDAVGAKAAVLRGGGPTLWRRVRPDGSFAVANDPRVLFGLGDGAPRLDGVRVVWPDGAVEDFPVTETGRYHTLRQGGGRPAGGADGRR
jgi:hypothetical protein